MYQIDFNYLAELNARIASRKEKIAELTKPQLKKNAEYIHLTNLLIEARDNYLRFSSPVMECSVCLERDRQIREK